MDTPHDSSHALGRRSFLARTGLAISAAAAAPIAEAAARVRSTSRRGQARTPTWPEVRSWFALDRRYAHLAGMLFASHPLPVREAIERHRSGLDRHPVHYLYDNRWDFESRVLDAAATYLGADPRDVALTDSTTMGLATLYNGVRLDAGKEAVATTHCHYSTRESLRLRGDRTGASVREVALYDDLATVTADELVEGARRAVGPSTRLLAITWVHSSTGLKLPVRRIADALAEINRDRAPRDRVLLAVDGVHAFGVEDVAAAELGCDFFVAGCHKWLHGPRGTGLVWATSEAWAEASPTIPAFGGHDRPGGDMTPGGFHSFEHRWALAEAFEMHARLGRARVAERVYDLARHVKEGLAAIPGVRVRTPASPELSAGLVCFELDAMSTDDACEALWDRRVVASVAPYEDRYLRLSPGIANTHADVDRALRAIREIAGRPKTVAAG